MDSGSADQTFEQRGVGCLHLGDEIAPQPLGHAGPLGGPSTASITMAASPFIVTLRSSLRVDASPARSPTISTGTPSGRSTAA